MLNFHHPYLKCLSPGQVLAGIGQLTLTHKLTFANTTSKSFLLSFIFFANNVLFYQCQMLPDFDEHLSALPSTPPLLTKATLQCNQTVTIIHQLPIYTSMKHSLLFLKLLALALNSLDTLSDVRIKAFTLLF
jgi:hypothetical protein